ncbi:MAG: Holliday junction resolvase RuvX [Actinomycetota bacterium]|nr:Holliday junction resolvase RuvX [Actinomycetota bacterium]
MADEPRQVSRKGPVLGLDLGQSRIGVAISDPDRRVAVALGTVRTGAPEDVKAIAALVKEHGVTEIVVGHPLSLSGEAGEAAEHAERFAEALGGFLGIRVVLHDERLSTVEAGRGLTGAGVDPRRRRDVIDQAAAVVILQSYLEGLR